jgi:DNA-binding HxlR family transcriptional regulator
MTSKHTQSCPIAATTNILGDRWTLLILREAFRGVTRFGDFQAYTGAAKTILSKRLVHLVEQDLFETFEIGETGSRSAYRLTDKGKSLSTVLIAIHQWGNTHVYGQGNEPILLVERDTGDVIPNLEVRGLNGAPLSSSEIKFKAGPGARETTLKRVTDSNVGLQTNS